MAVNTIFDRIAMLLSSDWYLPYWSSAGISCGSAERVVISRAMREIVAHFLESTDMYWEADFSTRRLEETHREVRDRLKMHGVDVDDRGFVGGFRDQIYLDGEDVAAIEMLNCFIVAEPQIAREYFDEPMIDRIKFAWTSITASKSDIRDSYYGLNSEWDLFLQRATINVKDFLLDFAELFSNTRPGVFDFLRVVKSDLTTEEVNHLSSVYSQMGCDILGVNSSFRLG